MNTTTLAIAEALRKGTLRIEEAVSRFGEKFVTLNDEHGLIEIAENGEEANARIAEVRQKFNL